MKVCLHKPLARVCLAVYVMFVYEICDTIGRATCACMYNFEHLTRARFALAHTHDSTQPFRGNFERTVAADCCCCCCCGCSSPSPPLTFCVCAHNTDDDSLTTAVRAPHASSCNRRRSARLNHMNSSELSWLSAVWCVCVVVDLCTAVECGSQSDRANKPIIIIMWFVVCFV